MDWKNQIITALIGALLKLLKPEVLKKAVDGMLDKVEEAVTNSSNKIDDALVLPLCRQIREVFNVPDDDNIG